MGKIYNFFLDIDGTMLAKGKQTLSPRLVEALKFAQSQGSKIFINTGRTKAFVPYGLKTNDCFDGLCCGCGTYVEYQGKTVYEHYLSREKLTELCELYLKHELNSDIIFEGYERMYYLGEALPWFNSNSFIKINNPNYFKTAGFEPKVHKFSTHNKEEKSAVFFDEISSDYDIMIFPNYAEGVPVGFDKGKAMQITEELLSLDPKLSVAVGDSLNDAAMLKYAATSVAMGNATDEVKSMCDIITDTVENDGVAKLIYDLMG